MSAAKARPVTAALLRRWPLPDASDATSKEHRGRVLVIGGSREIPGAAMLAAVAALRVGAGKLQIATAQEAAVAMAVACPEARVVGVATAADGELRALPGQLLKDAARADAVVFGPGMRRRPALRSAVARLLQATGCGVVLDAGALLDVRGLADPSRVVLTPHHGEMAALSGADVETIGADPQAAAAAFARRSGAVMVLKSATTVIAAPDGRMWVHDGGSVSLGTSGSGDVLSGIVAGLIARGAGAAQAAVWGVYLHAQAGAALERRQGPLGPLAREIAAELPALLPD